MTIAASWGAKKFVCDSRTITMLNEISLMRELDVEELESKDGKNPTNTKGFKPQNLQTTHHVSTSTGTDPRKEFEEWCALLGKRGGFHIEGTRIGPPALILDRVEIDVTAINNAGEFLDADIMLTFSEDVNFVIAPKPATEKYIGENTKVESAPGIQPNGGTTKSAYNVRPSAAAAEEKMQGVGL